MVCVILCDACHYVWCVLSYFILLYCTVLYRHVFHCSTLLPGINPFSVNNNNILRVLTKTSSVRLLSAVIKVVQTACFKWILINLQAWNGIGPYIEKWEHHYHFLKFRYQMNVLCCRPRPSYHLLKTYRYVMHGILVGPTFCTNKLANRNPSIQLPQPSKCYDCTARLLTQLRAKNILCPDSRESNIWLRRRACGICYTEGLITTSVLCSAVHLY